jgi:Domain of unknown function (DUF4335)
MTIQRQYSLPNCQLVIEGLSQGVADMSGRPPISVVTHVICKIAGHDRPLVGGRELLDSLVKAVSEYAQEYLSGIPHPAAHVRHRGNPELVQLQKIDSNLHRLTVQPQVNNPTGKDKSQMYQAPETPAAQLDLTTVQLFDMVEAVDQFFADAQTVPELALNLTPLSKRYAAAQEPIAKRAVPAALGLSSLAVAAIALFYVPNPPNRRPQPIANNPAVTNPLATGSPSPTGAPSPSASVSPSASPSASVDEIENQTSTTSTTLSGTAASPAASPINSQDLDAILRSSTEVTDPDKLDDLIAGLQTKLYQEWNYKPIPTFTTDLEYRVGVAENGDILGFKYANDAALTYVKETPLLDLRYNSTGASREPVAQLRVVFKPNSVLEVSPWDGVPSEQSSP